jgi:hypothetical protein
MPRLKNPHTYIHTYHSRLIPKGRLRYSSETLTFYQNDLAMRNTADVTGGKPIAVWLQFILGGDAVNPLIAFCDIHERERVAILLFWPGHHARPPKVYLPYTFIGIFLIIHRVSIHLEILGKNIYIISGKRMSHWTWVIDTILRDIKWNLRFYVFWG